jgi:CRISPR-associated exonuclease Cas4
MEESDDLVPISALQHYLYCPRQCVLIHVERLWAENRQTAEGSLAARPRRYAADRAPPRRAHDYRDAAVQCGTGHRRGGGRGRVQHGGGGRASRTRSSTSAVAPRPTVPTRCSCARRPCAWKRCSAAGWKKAPCSTVRRAAGRRWCSTTNCVELTLETIQATREMIRAGQTPTASYLAKRCDACSLIDLCQPKLLGKGRASKPGYASRLPRNPDACAANSTPCM